MVLSDNIPPTNGNIYLFLVTAIGGAPVVAAFSGYYRGRNVVGIFFSLNDLHFKAPIFKYYFLWKDTVLVSVFKNYSIKLNYDVIRRINFR